MGRIGRTLILGIVVFGSVGLGRADVQPGETITKENMTQAEALLTPATRWMVERGMPIQVVETKPVKWPQAYEEATERYAAQVEIADDGREIFNYVAGAPFPVIDMNDPLAGYKIMWNHEQNPSSIDNLGVEYRADVVNSQGGVDRTYASTWRRMMWTGRLYTDPKPIIPHNPSTRYSNLLGPYTLPNDKAIKGFSMSDYRYEGRSQADDVYAYLPPWKKVRRISFANRGEGWGGQDFDFDSFYGFNGKIPHWTFRVMADKDILAVVHSGKYGEPSQWCAPRDSGHGILAALPCVAWEKRRVWVVEATPTHYPREYMYSKRILYMDQEFSFPLIQEMHDQSGALWKGMVSCLFYTKKPYAGYPANPLAGAKYNYTEEWRFIPSWVLLDVQEVQATAVDSPPSNVPSSEWRTDWYFNETVDSNAPAVYSPTHLLRSARN